MESKLNWSIFKSHHDINYDNKSCWQPGLSIMTIFGFNREPDY